MGLRNKLKITILVMLFLSSTILVTTEIDGSSSNISADQTVSTTSTTVVYVNPENNTYDIDETFTIEVIIANVTDLYGVDIQFSWDPTILEYQSHTAKIPVEDFPDGVLHGPGIWIRDEVDETASMPGALPGTMYWLAFASMDPALPFDGTGTAFSMTFKVISLSASTLVITKASLSDSGGWPIDRIVKDGYFLPVGAPEARFTWWPDIGVVGKPTVFNASESFDLGGAIVKYYWDFDDGNTTATTNDVINHTFTHTDPARETYDVSLIVEDDTVPTGINSTKTVKAVIIAKSRNIKMGEVVLPDVPGVLVNSTIDVTVTIRNDGSYANETCTLTAYYNTSATVWTTINATSIFVEYDKSVSHEFAWNTTGVEAEKHYVVKINATTVPYEDETDNTMTSDPVFITAEEVHDLAVETLSFQASYGGQNFTAPLILGESAAFTITIKNNGTVPEQTYNVTLYSNGTLLREWNITEALPSGATDTLTWTWNEIPQRGLYNITTQVTIANDNDTQNNRLQEIMQVIETPLLQIDYTPETPIVNQTVTLNASSSMHREPEGNITSYSWEIYTPDQTVDIDIPVYKSGITFVYNFTQAGNWTIVLKVGDNYGITYVGKRILSSDYRLEEKKLVQSEAEEGGVEEGIPIEHIAIIIIVVIFAVIAALLVIYRRRSKPTLAE